jgi:diguanylate cyclase (GGDEF)-like protein
MSSYATATVLFFGGIYLTPLMHAVPYVSADATIIEVGLVVGLLVQLGYARELGRITTRDVEQSARNAALVERLNELVIHDPLTGAYSRRYTFEQMEQLVSIRQRHGSSASAIMFDLDHFKVINDTYGHPTGDRALCEAVRAVGAQLRDGDLLGRIGGEEFLVLLPKTDMAAARPLAERLRQTLAGASIADGTQTIKLPASFGIAELQAAESQEEWFRRVDGALYQAKNQGRNTVVAAE